MKKFMVMALFLVSAGLALAAAPAHKHAVSPEMKMQHKVMSQANKHWRLCKEGMEKGDPAAAQASLGQMQKALTGLEKLKPHKNKDKTEEFRMQAQSLQESLAKLGDAVKSGKKDEVRSLSSAIDRSCLDCHETFR